MQANQQQPEWVNILSKGTITIPKKIREKIGINDGDIAKMTVENNRIIIEPQAKDLFESVRVFTKNEIKRWIKEDKLPAKSAKKTQEYWKNLP